MGQGGEWGRVIRRTIQAGFPGEISEVRVWGKIIFHVEDVSGRTGYKVFLKMFDVYEQYSLLSRFMRMGKDLDSYWLYVLLYCYLV